MAIQVRLTPAAAAVAAAHGGQLTVESVVVSSCCGAPQPPAVRPGPPPHPEGFVPVQAGPVTVWIDSLLEPPPVLEIDLERYPNWQELVVRNWPL